MTEDNARLTLAEKVLAPIAAAVIVGWIMRGTYEKVGLFTNWFPALSFAASILILLLVGLKFLGKLDLFPEKLYRVVLSTACLLPLFGFFIANVTESPGKALTFVGSVALAYIGLTTFWRKRIPKAALDPLGTIEAREEGAAAASETAPPPPEGAARGDETDRDDGENHPVTP